MNHFLLPGTGNVTGGDATRYGVHLMELLINGLLKKGARRDRLEAKVFGGAKTIASFSNVGEQNAIFAMQFLKDEGIPVISSSTGGDHGRKIEFWPVSGRARQHPLSGAETQKTVAMETRPVPAPSPSPTTSNFSSHGVSNADCKQHRHHSVRRSLARRSDARGIGTARCRLSDRAHRAATAGSDKRRIVQRWRQALAGHRPCRPETRGLAEFIDTVTGSIPGDWIVDVSTALSLVKLAEMQKALGAAIRHGHSQPLDKVAGDFDLF